MILEGTYEGSMKELELLAEGFNMDTNTVPLHKKKGNSEYKI